MNAPKNRASVRLVVVSKAARYDCFAWGPAATHASATSSKFAPVRMAPVPSAPRSTRKGWPALAHSCPSPRERPSDNRERTYRQEEPDQVEQPAVGPEPTLRNDADRLVGVAAPVGLEHGCDERSPRSGDSGNGSDTQQMTVVHGDDGRPRLAKPHR